MDAGINLEPIHQIFFKSFIVLKVTQIVCSFFNQLDLDHTALVCNLYGLPLSFITPILIRQGRNILLLIDNAPTHALYENTHLTNVTIEHLPPNIMAHLQPCDQGIINSFKV